MEQKRLLNLVVRRQEPVSYTHLDVYKRQLLSGLDRLLENELGVPVFVADDALNCVANGCGVMLENTHYVK